MVWCKLMFAGNKDLLCNAPTKPENDSKEAQSALMHHHVRLRALSERESLVLLQVIFYF